jgi:hypothetical protein
MAGRCCVKRGSIAFAKSQLTMIGLLFASGASSSSSSPSSSHGNHATKWHLVTRLLGLPLSAIDTKPNASSKRSTAFSSPLVLAIQLALLAQPSPCCRWTSSGTLVCWTLVLGGRFTRRVGNEQSLQSAKRPRELSKRSTAKGFIHCSPRIGHPGCRRTGVTDSLNDSSLECQH